MGFVFSLKWTFVRAHLLIFDAPKKGQNKHWNHIRRTLFPIDIKVHRNLRLKLFV